MNKKLIGIGKLLAAAVLVAAAFALSACAPAGPSAKDVINDFIDGVNGRDSGDIKDTLDSDAEDYNTANMDFWDAFLPEANAPFDMDGYSKSGDVATVTITGGSGFEETWKFTMKETEGTLFEAGDVSIKKITRGGETIFN